MANRTVPTSASSPPVSGPDYLDAIAAKLAMLFDVIALPALTVTNSTNNYTITIDPELDDDVVQGMSFLIKPNVDNVDGSPVCVRVTSDNPYYEVVKADGSAFAAGEWASSTLYKCEFYDSKFYVTSRIPNAQNIPTVITEVFDTSGTWNKPTGYADTAIVEVECIAGGGGGRSGAASVRNGGGGGGYNTAKFLLGDLASTVSVTVGAGGAAHSAGGNSSFGSHISAGGGAAGTTGTGANAGGAGGNSGGAGTGGGAGGDASTSAAGTAGGSSIFGGGGGGGAGATSFGGGAGGNSWRGGGGGGGANGGGGSNGAGGLSVHGGAGGAGNGAGTGGIGSVPGGGGGGGATGAAGAAGRVIVRVYP